MIRLPILRFILPFGRLPRLEFWRDVAIVGIAVELAFLADGIIGVANRFSAFAIGLAAFAIMGLGGCSILVLAAQRLHDRGRSGWWVLIAVLPVVGQVWLVWNGVRPGTTGPNRYGPNMRSGQSAAAVFGDEPVTHVGHSPPVASTAVAWTIMVVLLALSVFALFQSPATPVESPGAYQRPVLPRDSNEF